MESQTYSIQVLKLISLLNQKPQETMNNKPQIFNEILKIMKVMMETDPSEVTKLQTDEIIMWFRAHLNDPKPQIRQNAIKFLRYLIVDKNILMLYRSKGIHYFIARSLERDYKPTQRQNQGIPFHHLSQNIDPRIHQQVNQQQTQQQYILQEILQALKFIHKWLDSYSGLFPKILGNALVSFAESCDEQLKRYAIMTLRVFALNAPEMCGYSGGIRLLIESALEPCLQDISDQIVWSILYLINEPQSRMIVRVYLDLSKWFSIFTEIDPPLEGQKNDKRMANKFESQLFLAKKALISILKSWQGLIYLGNERQPLRSLVHSLKQPIKPIIRQAIYDIINDLLALGNKESSGVAVVNRHQESGQYGEFKINNLLNNFLVMLIQVLLDCDLFKILVELSGLEDAEVAQPAQRFLKELSGLMFNLIPDCHRYTDFLISAANLNDPFLVDLKSWSSEIVNTMGNYAFDQKKKKNYVSKFLYECENLYLTTQLGLPSYKINNETIGIIKGQIESEADDIKFQNLIKQSMVLSQKEDYTKWSWDSILELLDNFLTNQNRFQEAIKNKVLKTLLNFFLPSNLQFVKVDWKPENFIQAKCGYLLLKLLIKDRKGREIMMQSGEGYFKISKSFIADLTSLLKSDMPNPQNRSSMPSNSEGQLSEDNALMFHSTHQLRESFQGQVQKSAQGSQNQLMNQDNYQQKMIREYISWIGLLSSTKHGQQMLQQAGIYKILMNYVDRTGRRDHILIHLIHSLDYGKQSQAREFFTFCLLNGSRILAKSCLDFIRLLFRSELYDFGSWAIDLLIKTLEYDEDIAQKALSVIEEVTQDSENMSKFIEKVNLKQLIKLASKSTFLISILSNKKGFERMYNEQRDWLLQTLEDWKDQESVAYIEKVEKVMCDALEFISNEESQTTFRFPTLLNNLENSYGALQFIYKMPWSMYVVFECPEFEGIIMYSVHIDYNGNNNQFTLIGTPNYANETQLERCSINGNHQFILKLYLSVGKVLIDNTCKDVQEPYYIRCDSNDRRHLGILKKDILMIEKNGITFIFDYYNENGKMRLQQIKVNVKLGEQKNNTIKMPAHIFGELAYTEQGFKMLGDYIDYFIKLLRNDNVTVQQKRSALWAIGHIAQSKHGVRLIRDLQLIPDLVRMAEQYPVLSLRGTCLYTLNMICTTNTGRKELEKFQWISHLNSNLGWLCIPKNIYQFFYIRVQVRENHQSYWAQQQDIWEKFNVVQSKIQLNEDQIKLLESISLMSNQLTQKEADREIQKMKQSKPELFQDIDIFHNLLLMLTFYKFKGPAKNKIYGYFDKIFTPTRISQIMEHPIYQQIGLQDGTII